MLRGENKTAFHCPSVGPERKIIASLEKRKNVAHAFFRRIIQTPGRKPSRKQAKSPLVRLCRIYLHRLGDEWPADAGWWGLKPAGFVLADCKSGSRLFNNEPLDLNTGEDNEAVCAGNAVNARGYKDCGKRSLTDENGMKIAK